MGVQSRDTPSKDQVANQRKTWDLWSKLPSSGFGKNVVRLLGAHGECRRLNIILQLCKVRRDYLGQYTSSLQHCVLWKQHRRREDANHVGFSGPLLAGNEGVKRKWKLV